MRTRNRAERKNQRDQRGACSERVGEQRDGDVPASEPFTHDARSDDGGKEQRRSYEFRDVATHDKIRSLQRASSADAP
jgi:hypothetical protein